MKKEQATEVKRFIEESKYDIYRQTFVSKQETLHITITGYTDGSKNKVTEWIKSKEQERKEIIDQIKKRFPQLEVKENNKRYQGFINDICITVR